MVAAIIVLTLLCVVLTITCFILFWMWVGQRDRAECAGASLEHVEWDLGNLHDDRVQLELELKESEERFTTSTQKLREAVSKNKSIEVRTGQIMEKMAPFLEAFNHNPRNAQFLGQPIDYIVFADDEIVLVEVKTGKSRPSPKQNRIKRQVEDGKVRFEIVRFDYE